MGGCPCGPAARRRAGGVAAFAAGLLELLPGLGLLFFAPDLPALFDPAESSPALIDFETRTVTFNIGVDYTPARSAD